MAWLSWVKSLIFLGVFLLLGTPLIMAHSLLFPFIAGKAFFFRTIVEVVFLLWLLLALLDSAYRPRWSALSIVFFSWIAWIGVTALMGANPAHSFWSNFERMEGVITYLHLAAYFIVLISVLKTQKSWWWFWHLNLAVSGVVCCLALGEWLRGAAGGRLAATFGNPIYLAVYLLISLFLTLFFLIDPQTKRSVRWSYGGLGVVQAAILYGTATRGAMLGVAVGLLVTAALIGWFGREERRWRRGALGLIGAIVIVASLFVTLRQTSFIQSSPVLSRFANISLADATTRHRLLVWNISWQGFKERPLLGWGPENFNLVFAKHFDSKLYDAEPWFDRSHNILLDWLVTSGIFGLAGYLSLFVLAVLYFWRSSLPLVSKSLLIGLLVGYLFQNTLVFDNLTSYLLFVGLLAFAQSHRPSPSAVRSAPSRFSPGTVAPIIVLLLLLWVPGFYWSLIRPWRAGQTLIAALNTPDSSSRLSLFNQAYAYNTFAEQEITEQLVPIALAAASEPALPEELRAQWLSLSAEHLQSLVRQAPTDPRLLGLAGSFYGRIGRNDEAIASLVAAQKLSPQKQAIGLQLATAYYLKGDLGAAERVAREMFELEPKYEEARKFYALVLIAEKRFTEAAALMAVAGVEPDDRFINAYAALGQYEELLKLWQKKVAADPGNADYHLKLSAAYLKAGQRAAAILELETARKLNPAAAQEINFFISEIRAGRDPSK